MSPFVTLMTLIPELLTKAGKEENFDFVNDKRLGEFNDGDWTWSTDRKDDSIRIKIERWTGPSTNDTEILLLPDYGRVRLEDIEGHQNAISNAIKKIHDRHKSNWILKDYEHVAVIGEGYFSTVKWYRRKTDGGDFAVKILRPEYTDNDNYVHWFKREVRILEQLRGHENIVELVDYQLDENRYLYIMEKATSNLHNYIKRYNSSLGIESRVRIFDSVLSAIKYAHSKDILHRDINPNNVLLLEHDNNIVVKVSDFGMGKDMAAGSAFTRTHVAQYGQIYYTAPEQRLKLKDATVLSDIYSLGKLLSFICLGKDPDILRQCDFSSLINKAANEDPDSRYSNIDEFICAYEKIKSILQAEGTPFNSRDITFLSQLIELVKEAENIDWYLFHRLAIKGSYDDHIYSDYIDPAIRILDNGRLYDYYKEVGSSIVEFISTFSDRVNILVTQTGWPFSATESFGILFRTIYLSVEELEVKLQCLKSTWDLAYIGNQYSCQRIMRSLLNESIPRGIQTDFAMHIFDSNCRFAEDQFLNLSIPAVIRRAINSKIHISDDVVDKDAISPGPIITDVINASAEVIGVSRYTLRESAVINRFCDYLRSLDSGIKISVDGTLHKIHLYHEVGQWIEYLYFYSSSAQIVAYNLIEFCNSNSKEDVMSNNYLLLTASIEEAITLHRKIYKFPEFKYTNWLIGYIDKDRKFVLHHKTSLFPLGPN